jgi:hypothetical protein
MISIKTTAGDIAENKRTNARLQFLTTFFGFAVGVD